MMSFKISRISLLIWISVTSSISMLPGDRQVLTSDRKTNVRIVFNISSPGKRVVTQKTLFIEHNIMSMVKSYKIYESLRTDDPGVDQFVIKGPLIHTFSGTGSSLKYLQKDACSPIVNRPEGQTSWVALFSDDNCSQTDKSKNVQDVGAKATIMYSSDSTSTKKSRVVSVNDRDRPDLISVFVSYREIKSILSRCYNSSYPFVINSNNAIFTNQSDQLILRKRMTLPLNFDWTSICNVTIDIYRTSRENFLNRTSVLFVSVSFILLMIISLAWLVFYYVQRFRYIHVKEEYARRVARLAKKAVAKIDLKHIKAGDKETDPEYDQCIICIEPYNVSDNVRILPCKHYFHKSCIDPWLLDQRSCPICKMNILQHFGMIPGDINSVLSDRDSDPNFSLVMPLNNVNSSTGDNYELVSGDDSSSRPNSGVNLIQYIKRRWLRRRNSSLNQLGSRGTSAVAVNIPSQDYHPADSHSSTSAPVVAVSLGSRDSLKASSQSSLDAAAADESVSSTNNGDKEVVCLRVQLERTPVNSQIVEEASLNDHSSEAMLYPTTNSVIG